RRVLRLDDQTTRGRRRAQAQPETAYLQGQYRHMEVYAHVVLDKAQRMLDKARVYEILIQAFQAQNKYQEAIDSALEILSLLGVRLPSNPTRLNVMQTLLSMRFQLRRYSSERLLGLPAMQDTHYLAAMRILANITATARIVAPGLGPIVFCKLVELSLRYGNTAESAVGYASYALICAGVWQNLEDSSRFGRVAVRLQQQLQSKSTFAKVNYLVNGILLSDTHMRDTLQPLKETLPVAQEIGDLEFGALSVNSYAQHAFLSGQPLETLLQEMALGRQSIATLNQHSILTRYELYRQVVLNLFNDVPQPWHIKGEAYDVDASLPHHLADNEMTTLLSLNLLQLILNYLFRRYDEALESANQARRFIVSAQGMTPTIPFYLYDSLARLAISADADRAQKQKLLKQVKRNQNLIKRWSRHAPANFLHEWHLVEAEKARLDGNKNLAMEQYDQAIALAREYTWPREEALANELAGRFWLETDKQEFANIYLRKAHYGYTVLGAKAKVSDMEKSYSTLTSQDTTPIPHSRQLSTTPPAGESIDLLLTKSENQNSNPSTSVSGLLDFTTLMKAMQAISSEIIPDNLIRQLMQVVIENAGAQAGFLILNKNEQFIIEAEVRAHNNTKAPRTSRLSSTQQAVMKSIFHRHPLTQEDSPDKTLVPAALIHYVLRTRQSLVLSNALEEGAYTQDPYILANQVKSVLCLPVMQHQQLIGALYLENNLAAGTFTEARLLVIKTLSTQIAISLQNAALFTRTEEALEEAEQARQHSEAASKAKSAFLANMSHELRTPMNAILGYGEMLKEDAEDSGYEELLPDLERIQQAGNNLLNIISDVLILVRSKLTN
ncbi:MAG: histidine kinase dimerization/phospho-acceptor domain-containing protein, partial [Pseudomonadota bacterium]